jgi:hypothetical protein
MNYLQDAINFFDRSQGDVRDEEWANRLTVLAATSAAIAQAQATERLAAAQERTADALEVIASVAEAAGRTNF